MLWLNFVLWIGFLWAYSAHIFSLAKMASEEQKPLAKMDFLLVCGYLATVSLEPCYPPDKSLSSG